MTQELPRSSVPYGVYPYGDIASENPSVLEALLQNLPIVVGILGGAPTGYLLSRYLLRINPWLGAALGAGLGGGAGYGVQNIEAIKDMLQALLSEQASKVGPKPEAGKDVIEVPRIPGVV